MFAAFFDFDLIQNYAEQFCGGFDRCRPKRASRTSSEGISPLDDEHKSIEAGGNFTHIGDQSCRRADRPRPDRTRQHARENILESP